MAEVEVLINGRAYAVGCDDGEEEHIRELGRYLDKHAREITQSVGHFADARLLLMAGLLVADELYDMAARVEKLEAEIAHLRKLCEAAQTQTDSAQTALADAIGQAARRIELIARNLEAA